jgi:hypothetical protein
MHTLANHLGSNQFHSLTLLTPGKYQPKQATIIGTGPENMAKPARFMSSLLLLAAVVYLTTWLNGAEAGVQVEIPCRGSTRRADFCGYCCESEGYARYLFIAGKSCNCEAPTPERKLQEFELLERVNEYTCNEFSGPSHGTTKDGTRLEAACGQCCHANGFRRSYFEIDHSFGHPIGNAQGSELAKQGHLRCRCDGLYLKFHRKRADSSTEQ